MSDPTPAREPVAVKRIDVDPSVAAAEALRMTRVQLADAIDAAANYATGCGQAQRELAAVESAFAEAAEAWAAERAELLARIATLEGSAQPVDVATLPPAPKAGRRREQAEVPEPAPNPEPTPLSA